MAQQRQSRRYEHVSLCPLQSVLEGYVPRDTGAAPEGGWSSSYKLYSLVGRGGACGEIILRKTILTDQTARFSCTYGLGCGKGIWFRTQGEMTCCRDLFCTPLDWTARSTHVDSGSRETADSPVVLSGRRTESGITIGTAGAVRSYTLGNTLSWGWGLFDVVQRFAVQPDPPVLRFDLLDHFDQVKHRHQLKMRKRCTLLFGGKMAVQEVETRLDRGTIYRPVLAEKGGIPVDCVVFEQVGRGILPIVYWCTASGQLLIVSSGLEAYVRQEGA